MRSSVVCPPTRICCPTCGHRLMSASTFLRAGDAFAQCNHRHTMSRTHCNQHVFLYGRRFLWTVWAVTEAERRRFEHEDASPEEILAALGEWVLAEVA